MHPILRRHLSRLNLSEESDSVSKEQWSQLLAALENCFKQFDGDRQFQERSMAIASEEMETLHRSLATTNSQLAERTEQLHLALQEAKSINADLSRAKLDAEAANKSKSAFLANMSHEIRTPLTAILGFAEVLRDDGYVKMSAEQRSQTFETINSAGVHLLTVINDILDLSKIEADKVSVEKIETPLVGLLHEVESLMRQRAIGKGVALKTMLTTPVPAKVISDPTRLRQILMNLVGNAVKFTESGTITLRAGVELRGEQSWIVIYIDDTGPGMTPDQVARLFTAFGQADDTMTRKHGGTGLGLTICLRLASLMGGTVSLARTAPGAGSSFKVELPLTPVANCELVERMDVLRDTGKPKVVAADIRLNGRILLAEDGIDNQRLIAHHLKKAGAVVDIADNGRIALEKIEKSIEEGTPYAMLLTDMQMPEMDGYQLARTLRQRGCTLAVVALTAHAMAEDRAKCQAAGCDDYATKPIDRLDLIKRCGAWIGKQSQHPLLAKPYESRKAS